jgi:hypothetical protein
MWRTNTHAHAPQTWQVPDPNCTHIHIQTHTHARTHMHADMASARPQLYHLNDTHIHIQTHTHTHANTHTHAHTHTKKKNMHADMASARPLTDTHIHIQTHTHMHMQTHTHAHTHTNTHTRTCTQTWQVPDRHHVYTGSKIGSITAAADAPHWEMDIDAVPHLDGTYMPDF